VSRVESSLKGFEDTLAKQRDETIASLEQRALEVETGLGEQLRKTMAEAESERTVLEGRLRDLARRIDELVTRT
jgi:hypothetical protein